MTTHRAKVRITSAVLSGVMLLDGQRIPFKAHLDYPKIDADFPEKDENSNVIDQWKAFRALETFIDEQLRG